MASDAFERYGEKVIEFYKELLYGHGFECGLMEDCEIKPTIQSNCMQNYVLGMVSKGKFGVSRVDHSSSGDKSQLSTCSYVFPVLEDVKNCAINLSLAIEFPELRGIGRTLDYGTHANNYFYTAGQVYGGNPNRDLLQQCPKTRYLAKELDELFFESYYKREPKPIKESKMLGLCRDLGLI